MALLDPQDKTVVSGIGALCSTHRQPNTSISLGGLKTGDRAFSRSLSFAWSAFGDFQRERFSRRRTDLVVRPHQGRPFFRSKSPRVVFFSGVPLPEIFVLHSTKKNLDLVFVFGFDTKKEI